MELSIIIGLKMKAQEKRERNRQAAIDEVEQEYHADIRAIERLEALDSDGQATKKLPEPEPMRGLQFVPQNRGKLSPITATREAVANLSGQFDVRNIDAFILQRHGLGAVSRAAISVAIHKMVRNGEMQVIQKPRGRRPGIYKRSDKESNYSLNKAHRVNEQKEMLKTVVDSETDEYQSMRI